MQKCKREEIDSDIPFDEGRLCMDIQGYQLEPVKYIDGALYMKSVVISVYRC